MRSDDMYPQSMLPRTKCEFLISNKVLVMDAYLQVVCMWCIRVSSVPWRLTTCIKRAAIG